MDVNLHMVMAELGDLDFLGAPKERYAEFPHQFALPFDPDRRLLPEAIYVGSVEDVERTTGHEARAAVICLGEPSDTAIGRFDNLVYTKEHLDATEVLERVAEALARYDRWEQELADIVATHAEAARFGAVTRKVVPNPIFVANEGFKVLFHDAEVLKGESYREYERYCTLMSGEKGPIRPEHYPPREVIREMVGDPSYGSFVATDEPRLFPQGDWPYRTIAYNFRTSGDKLGTICMDEVLHPLCGRDYAVLKILGDYVEKAVRLSYAERFSRTGEENYVLDNLLAHKFIDAWRIGEVVRGYGWDVYDTYLCLAVESTSYNKSDNLLQTLAPDVTRLLDTRCSATYQGRLVCVANLTRLGCDRAALMRRVEHALADDQLMAGISRPYNDFKDLYYYYRQARRALELREGDARCVSYEQVAPQDVVTRYRGSFPKEAVIPEGLARLAEYDRAQGSNLVGLLRVYLDCGMSATETSRRTYTARNTCIYRLRRIGEIAGLDLVDPDTRLLLDIGLRAMAAGD